MDNEFTGVVGKLMRAVTDLSGLSLRWKTRNGFWPDDGLARGQYVNTEFFCSKIRKDSAGKKLCFEHEGRGIEKRALEEQKPFYIECHAGAVQLIVPFIRGEFCEGFLSAGPMRGTCRCPGASAEFGKLPGFDLKRCESMKTILSVLAEYIIDKQIFLRFREMAEQAKDPRIKTAIHYINIHFRRKIGVAQAAKQACLSTSRFIRLFKKECGLPFTGYLLTCRIEEGKKLLLGTNMSIVEVALNSGFPSQSYFGQVIRKHTGCTPREYRKKFQFKHLGGRELGG